MLRTLFAIALAAHLSLILISGLFPHIGWLPLGGGPLPELGFVLGTATVIAHLSGSL